MKNKDSESENIDKLKERIAELEYDLLAYRRPTNVRVIDVRKDERRKVLEEAREFHLFIRGKHSDCGECIWYNKKLAELEVSSQSSEGKR